MDGGHQRQGAWSEFVRDPLANLAAVRAARRRPMSERLELALSWNSLAAELRAGILAARAGGRGRPAAERPARHR